MCIHYNFLLRIAAIVDRKKKVRYLPLFCSLNWIFLIWHKNKILFEILSLKYRNKNNGQIVTNTWYCVIMFSLALWYWIMRLQCMTVCVYIYMQVYVVSCTMPYWHAFVRKKICKEQSNKWNICSSKNRNIVNLWKY